MHYPGNRYAAAKQADHHWLEPGSVSPRDWRCRCLACSLRRANMRQSILNQRTGVGAGDSSDQYSYSSQKQPTLPPFGCQTDSAAPAIAAGRGLPQQSLAATVAWTPSADHRSEQADQHTYAVIQLAPRRRLDSDPTVQQGRIRTQPGLARLVSLAQHYRLPWL